MSTTNFFFQFYPMRLAHETTTTSFCECLLGCVEASSYHSKQTIDTIVANTRESAESTMYNCREYCIEKKCGACNFSCLFYAAQMTTTPTNQAGTSSSFRAWLSLLYHANIGGRICDPFCRPISIGLSEPTFVKERPSRPIP